jgi:hypothetical protein
MRQVILIFINVLWVLVVLAGSRALWNYGVRKSKDPREEEAKQITRGL